MLLFVARAEEKSHTPLEKFWLDDRVGIEILSLASADREVGSWIAARDVQLSGLRVEGV
jgi:hypothetical protein